MRGAFSALISLLAVGLTAWGSSAQGEPVKQPGISFSVPYICSKDERGNETQTERLCLADSFKPNLNVVLVTDKGNCSARTAATFKDAYACEFEAAHLTGTEECLAQYEKKAFDIAIVGINPSDVQVVKATNDKSPLSKEIDLKARKIASLAYKKIQPSEPGADVANSPPDVHSVGNTAFLLYRSTLELLNQDGLPVLVLKNKAFLLEGMCALTPPFFFSVKEKLHLAYWATYSCCGCGDSIFLVYDLSGGSPKSVYQNCSFSD